MRFRVSLPCCLLLLLLGGCVYPVRRDVDAVVCDLTAHPLDVHAPGPADIHASEQSRTSAPESDPAMRQAVYEEQAQAPGAKSGPGQAPGKASVPMRPETPNAPEPKQPAPSGTPPRVGFEQRMQLPQSLPGAGATIRLPPVQATPEEKRSALQALFPQLPTRQALPKPAPGPFGHPLTLPELQQLATANNPVLRQRAADVKAAEGALRQAGAYPNPTFGYESDTAGTGNTAGYQGGFLEQLIKTAGKLKLAQARAAMDLFNAQVALRAAQSDVMTQVRTGYFGVLVADRSLRWSWDLAEFTERVYRISVENAVQGLLAGYEPMSLRGLAMTSLGVLAQGQTRYLAAWQQLAASLGLPELPLSEVAGDPEIPPPHFDQQAGLARVLSGHTDILTARNGQQRARYDLAIAQRTPVPDVDFRLAVQKDYTMPPFSVVYSVQAGMQIPIWDRNHGNIMQAQGALLRATEEEHRARADLASRYADAFSRFEANRALVNYYRTSILPDASRVYTRTLLRFNTQLQGADDRVAFVDIVTYQQFYVTSLANYLAALHDMWQAVADLGGLLQSEDLFLGTDLPCPGPTDPAQLPPLPCSHPCNPLAGGACAAPVNAVAAPSLPVQQLPMPAALPPAAR